ncbi:MAG TPA: glucose 1-dehydrogenase [Saprospiraceae bacterium]|nr:glucose 1-dehydrogenase [Saprospiraceae bacterium]HMQ84477.1 glucose 1-dehydrogenase [Saprospiraceae bacterium]
MGTLFDLNGKLAIVSGAGSGIGQSIAFTLATYGAEVAILDVNELAAQQTSAAIQQQGGSASFHVCDVSQLESVASIFETITAGKNLDILINNAGIAHVGNVEHTTAADFDRVLNVNVKGVYHCLKAGVQHMKARGGSIVNVCSVAAYVGIPDRFAYSMSKGAVHAMTLSVAKDYLSYQIRCNGIAPGRVHTPFVDGFLAQNYPGREQEMFDKLSKTQPIGRMGQADEIGALVLYLCSDEAAFITGTSFPIDGGFITLNN